MAARNNTRQIPPNLSMGMYPSVQEEALYNNSGTRRISKIHAEHRTRLAKRIPRPPENTVDLCRGREMSVPNFIALFPALFRRDYDILPGKTRQLGKRGRPSKWDIFSEEPRPLSGFDGFYAGEAHSFSFRFSY